MYYPPALPGSDSTGYIKRPNWWLRLVSSGWQVPPRNPQEREQARRSKFMAWIIPALILLSLLVILAGLHAPSTEIAGVALILGTVLVAFMNRAGYVSVAGTFLVLLVMGLILGAVVATGTLTLIYLPAYDTFAIAVVLAAAILPPWMALMVSGVSVALILGDIFLQPHGADLNAAIAQFGIVGLIDRPIAVNVVVAVVAFLVVHELLGQSQRADRAEEVARLEHAFAMQQRQLQIGVQEILATHVRISNGDYNARAPLSQDNALWQISVSLNNLLGRFQTLGQYDHKLQRTEAEIGHVAAALRDLKSGRRPIWPARTGTRVDELIAIFASPNAPLPSPLSDAWRHQQPDLPRFGPGQTPAFGSSQIPGFSSGQLPGYGPSFGSSQAPGFGPGFGQAPGFGQMPDLGPGQTPGIRQRQSGTSRPGRSASEPSFPRESYTRPNRQPADPPSQFPPLEEAPPSQQHPSTPSFEPWPDLNSQAPFSGQPSTDSFVQPSEDWPQYQSQGNPPFPGLDDLPSSASDVPDQDGHPHPSNPWYLPESE